MQVPVEFINEDKSPGLKRGGVLNIVRHEIELRLLGRQHPAERSPSTSTGSTSATASTSASEAAAKACGRRSRPRLHRRRGRRAERAAAPRPEAQAAAAAAAATPEVPGGPGGGAPLPAQLPRPRRAPCQARAPRDRRQPAAQAPAEEGIAVGAGCGSWSAWAIPARATPGTGTISASWRWTRSSAAMASARGARASRAMRRGHGGRRKVLALKPHDLHEPQRPSGAGGAAVLQARARATSSSSTTRSTSPGQMRVKQGGGAAGHNGIRSHRRPYRPGVLARAPRRRPSRRARELVHALCAPGLRQGRAAPGSSRCSTRSRRRFPPGRQATTAGFMNKVAVLTQPPKPKPPRPEPPEAGDGPSGEERH